MAYDLIVGMGIFKKMKGAISSKANSALDAAIDPAKELDIIIMDLETQKKNAMKELLGYKTTAKQMDQSLEEQQQQAAAWEKRAMIAVKQGKDDIAKDCLKRKRDCEVEYAKIKRDQSEAAGYAAELNNSRKQLEVKLKMLKLRKGTMATQIAAARGEDDAFTQGNELFEKLEQAEQMIDSELFEQEAASELASEPEANAALEAALLKAARQPAAADSPDDALAQLKAEMGAKKKLLKE